MSGEHSVSSRLLYRTIVADPPWDHSDGTGVNFRRGGNVTHLPYPVMSVDEIASLPVSDLADRHAHLYLWTTTRYLEHAYPIARSWGFEPTAVLVWCKPVRGWTVGGTYASNVEFVIFATRRVGGDLVLSLTSRLADRAREIGVTRAEVDAYMGTSDMGGWWLSRLPHRCACPTDQQWQQLKVLLRLDGELDALVAEINAGKGETTALAGSDTRWFTWNRGEHSAKPDAFLDLVENISPGPRIELFARRQRLGWDTWGNQALEHVELTA